MHRREDVLQEVVVPILENLQIYLAFKKLAKHRSRLSGLETALNLKMKKLIKRRMLRRWHVAWSDTHAERENIEKAVRFR